MHRIHLEEEKEKERRKRAGGGFVYSFQHLLLTMDVNSSFSGIGRPVSLGEWQHDAMTETDARHPDPTVKCNHSKADRKAV